jgi:DNA-binding NtrC family response regulator
MVRLLLHSTDERLEGLLAATLGAEYRVRVEPDRKRVQQHLAAGQTDVLVLDFDSDQDSLENLLGYVSEIRPFRVPIVVMTEDDRRSTAMELVGHGVYDYFRKPPHLMELKIVIRRAHEHAQLQAELERTRHQLSTLTRCDQLIGSSRPMREVYDLVRKVADLTNYVLIKGESGTGKELVARAIHNLSSRGKAPFTAVACGAIPETLIEAELFGHEKGAYTGANGSREGYLEQAENGTLLLDELGELSLHTQVKLLRVLQEREFCRVGGTRPIPLRARVVFATHRSLAQMVDEGTFRKDLYFRVNVLKITVPPLRERREDIPQLAQHFAEIYGNACGRPAPVIGPGAFRALVNYDWPGNVRELENVVQRAVILAEDGQIGVESLPDTVAGLETGPGEDESFENLLGQCRIRLALQALAECQGNKTEAARRLRITRAYLHRLLRQAEGRAA